MGHVRSILARVVRRLRYKLSNELSRIDYVPGVQHGANVRLTGDVNFGSEPFLVSIGHDVTIADGVRLITHDGGVRVFRETYPHMHVYAPIAIGSFVFIGVDAIILPGVSVGDRCVVGAGSVVTKDVPPGSVVAGVPARRICGIDEYMTRAREKSIDWPVGDYGESWKAKLLTMRDDPS